MIAMFACLLMCVIKTFVFLVLRKPEARYYEAYTHELQSTRNIWMVIQLRAALG